MQDLQTKKSRNVCACGLGRNASDSASYTPAPFLCPSDLVVAEREEAKKTISHLRFREKNDDVLPAVDQWGRDGGGWRAIPSLRKLTVVIKFLALDVWVRSLCLGAPYTGEIT